MTKTDKIVSCILVAFIVAVAACARLYHPFAIPYAYDELSALFRTYYNSFTDMILYGVMMKDAHPAGIETLLYFWTKLVGYTELYVKLPFIICSVASVFYVFKIGKEWFNTTVGLVCAAYMATLQYTIMHGQEVRPYGIGLFFSAAMVYHWHSIVFRPEKRYDLNWVLYLLFSSLCMYNHYFSLAFAGLVALTGIFFVKRRYIMRYLTAGIMMIVLYTPHLHIFYYQFFHFGGGLSEWLAKPGNDYIIQYLLYIFHFSPYVYGLAAALLCWGIVYSIIRKKFPAKFFFISLAWFAIPFLVGFFYSRYYNPVLQYRVLIFSFPFLLFVLFGLLPDVHFLAKKGLVLLICAVNIFTLVQDRKYYTLYYQSPIRKVCSITDSLTRTMGKNNMLRFVEGDSSTLRMENFYVHRFNYDSSYLVVDNNNCKDKTAIIDYLEDHPRKYLSYGFMSEADMRFIPIFLNYYPYVVKQYNFFGGGFYILSSEKGDYKSPYTFESKEDFDYRTTEEWAIGDKPTLVDSIHYSGKYSCKIDSLHEYGPTFTGILSEMINMKNDIITVTAEIYPLSSNMDGVHIVAELEAGNKKITWTGTPMSDYIQKDEKKKWIKVYHTLKLSDVDIHYPNIQVKVYIWNQGKKNFLIDDFTVSTLKGNPYLYGIIEKLQ